MRAMFRACLFLTLFFGVPILALAEPVVAPGEMRLRHDLQLLNDSGLINVPLTAWPVSLGEIHVALEGADLAPASPALREAWERTRQYVAWELDTDSGAPYFSLSGAVEPRTRRGFENTPREEGEASLGWSWLGERLALNLRATYAANPFDGDEFRPDGTYVGAALGNWMLTAGWQDRWWGPSRDGSLILGNNARPTPGIGLQRIGSHPFESKWLSWLGPWTFTTFMTELDDEREINNALLFGLRGSFRPPGTGLEIGISRTAQWCGDDRPCDIGTFGDLLVGNDNRGVNVDVEDEPGNQLGGFDIRWRLPRSIPVAAYMQWIGEDGRGGGGAIGSWLRQLGLEYWGELGGFSHRTHIEVSDTTCRQGGFGFSEAEPGCAYNHSIYRTGYRYKGRPIGHSADGDVRAYSLGSTLVQSAGHSWNVSLRYMDMSQDLIDFQVSHDRETRFGRFDAGLGFSRLDDAGSDASFFLRWSSR